ncbi:MAG: hypothetical protein GY725_05485 [bacterium]|nr:hypothetical protein [bacterium]
MIGVRVSIMLVFLLCSSAVGAQTAEERLSRALEAYAQGLEEGDRDLRLESFRRAERNFAAVIDDGVENADLYANRGNSALLGERLGPAVLAYRRALQIDPDHRVARQNLEHARTLLPSWVPHPQPAGVLDTFFFWHRALSPGERTGFAAWAFGAACLLFAGAVFWRRPWLRNLGWIPALFWLAVIVSLAFDRFSSRPDEAVVTTPEVVARAADSINAPTRFSRPLPAGVEVQVLERRQGWTRVGLADGRDAWLAASAISRVKRD